MPRFLAAALREHVARRAEQAACAESFLFVTEAGQPVAQMKFYDGVFRTTVRRLRKTDRSFPAINFHSLRHFAVSDQIEAGANATEVASRVGHSSAAMVQSRYAHVFEARDRELAEKLDERYADRAAGTAARGSKVRALR